MGAFDKLSTAKGTSEAHKGACSGLDRDFESSIRTPSEGDFFVTWR
jgi:hypothetical protein